jgi:hypothetical protein
MVGRPSVAVVHWRDLEMSLLLLVGGAGAASYVARNEGRRASRTHADVAWTPYLAGASLGVVFACSLLVFGRPLGVSAGIQEAARLVERAVGIGPNRGRSWGWPLWVVLGVGAGGAVSSFLRGRANRVAGPEEGHGIGAWTLAFVAGLFLQIAAGIAGGCTSGLALSGGMVQAPAAFIFMAGLFVGGIPTARVARWLKGRRIAR